MIKELLASVVVAGLCASAHAQPKTFVGEGGPLVDGPDGTATFEIFVEEHNLIADFVSVDLFGFTHTWAGDLTITLMHESGTAVTLLDQPGVPESTFGDSANFEGDYSWVDGGFVYDADIFDDIVTETLLGPVAGALSDFAGVDKYGFWTLTIHDGAGGDTGDLTSWGFTVNNVPTPGALALLGVAGALGLRRRGRR